MGYRTQEKHDKASVEILERIMNRQNWLADTRDAITAVIGSEVRRETEALRKQLEKQTALANSLHARLVKLNYDGPLEPGKQRRRLNR